MEQIPISIQNQYNTNIPNNYIPQNNSIYHTKSPSYSNMKNIFPKKKQILINNIRNNYYNNNIPIETDFDTSSNYNKYNVTNNYYGNQIINNNFNYYSSSRNIRDIRNMNNQFYNNNNYINITTQGPINNYMKINNENNLNSINRVVKLNPNLNLDENIVFNNNYNIDIVQTPKSDMNFTKKIKSKEKFKNTIKNIDVNMDYQENNKNEMNIMDNDNDNISYFDISNFRSKLMKMNNVKVINNSITNKGVSHELKNSKINLSANNTGRKSSKVKNKISSKIPHNNIKSINLYPSNITENNGFKYNTSNSKKTMSKIPINMKRKIYEIKKVENDEESELNSQLYNTNAFSNRNRLSNNNKNFEKKIENNENKKYIIKNEKIFYNKDNNLDLESENYKSIKQINTYGENSSKYKTTTETSKNNLKINNDIFSIKSNSNENINNDFEPKSKNKNIKRIIIKHSKAKSNLINKKVIKDFKNKESEKENEDNNKLEENDLSKKINMVKIEKIESKLINKKIEIKRNKLNNSQSNETMNVSEMSNDDKIMKINDFSGKIKNNILLSIENTKDFNETKKIKNSNKNNININDIIKSNKRNSNDKIIKNVNYISKSKKSNKQEKNNEEYDKERNYFRKCIYKSIAGKDSFGNRKINQDLYLAQINFINIKGFNIFGVLDGHGENGHKVAAFARDFILSELNNYFQKHKPSSLLDTYSLLKKDNYSIIKDIYQKADKKLLNQNFNSNFSGSTCVIVFQIGNKLICSNVGDSRAILIYTSEENDSKLSSAKVFELSKDQKPELPEEKKRIYKMGGVVDQMLDSKGRRNGPFRVWAGKKNYPGLAMSRCIGDLKGKSCGLISEPEIIEYTLDENSKYMVICSDGVWEFSNNEDIMSIGIEYYLKDNIGEFIEKIIKVSEFWWEKEDIIRDDITAVVVYF